MRKSTKGPEATLLEQVIGILIPHCAFLARINGGAFFLKGRGTNRVFHAYRLFSPEVSGTDTSIVLPDLLGMLRDGRVLAVECKVVGGKVSDAQAAFLHLVRSGGGVAGVCFDGDDARELLELGHD